MDKTSTSLHIDEKNMRSTLSSYENQSHVDYNLIDMVLKRYGLLRGRAT